MKTADTPLMTAEVAVRLFGPAVVPSVHVPAVAMPEALVVAAVSYTHLTLPTNREV